MPTRQRYRTLLAQRLGGHQTLTVSLPPDTGDSAAQRLVLSTDLFDFERPATGFQDAWLWAGRYGDGRRVKRSSYRSTALTYLIVPQLLGVDQAFTLTFYGIGTTGSIDLTGVASAATRASTIQTAITSLSGLESATVVAISTTQFKLSVPQNSITVEISNSNGSVTSGIGSIEATRPFQSGLPLGTTVDLLPKLPAHDADGFVGLNSLINQALARLSFIDRRQFTPTDNETLVFPVAAEDDWLQTRGQVIQAYLPVARTFEATFTAPGSGSYALSLNLGRSSLGTTSSLDFDATASEIEDALRTAQAAIGHPANADVTGSGPFTVTIPETFYASPALTASAGTVASASTTRNDTQYRFDGWRFIFDGERRLFELDSAFGPGETWELEVYRPCHTWICPQADYETEGGDDDWAASTIGLSSDLDQAVGAEDAVVAIAHYLACRQLSTSGPAGEVRYWQGEASRAAAIAAQIKLFDTQKNMTRAPRDRMLAWERGRESKGFFGG